MQKVKTQTEHPVLRCEKLAIGYASKRKTTCLENDISLQVKAGEMVCLLGPNGSGKSTLMRTLAGLLEPLEGNVFISNVELNKLSAQKRAKLLSLVLTEKLTLGSMKVHDIVAIGRYPYINFMGKLSADDEQKVDESLRLVHMDHYSDTFYAELSDGEKQRVMIAKALAQDTPLIMLDEPTAHLDLPNRVEMMNTLKHLAQKTQKAILLSTHELDLALQSADTIWLMNQGQKMFYGVPEDLVLEGKFEQVFHNKSFVFDKLSGAFKLNHPTKKKLLLKGEGLQQVWTKRALQRKSFAVVDDGFSDICISINNNKWLVEMQEQVIECDNIQQLLETVE